MDFPDHPFWDFSLHLHERPGVPEACLSLQHLHGLDVNLLFFCCWTAGVLGRPLGREAVNRAVKAVAGWQEEVVRPVWKARRRIKEGFAGFPSTQTEPLRQTLIAAELDAEHLEQLYLAAAVSIEPAEHVDPVAGIAAAASNLAEYLASFFGEGGTGDRSVIPPDVGASLSILIRGAFPEGEEEGVRAALAFALGSQGDSYPA